MTGEDKDTAWFGFYKKAKEEVSRMYPVFCVCGHLCTGLHEIQCKKFQSAVKKRAKALYKESKNEKELLEALKDLNDNAVIYVMPTEDDTSSHLYHINMVGDLVTGDDVQNEATLYLEE